MLPGETPIPVPTIAPGTYREWDGTGVYEAGTRVLFEGIAFEAKWWTQGDSPGASSTEPDNSPWLPLTEAQILEVNRAG